MKATCSYFNRARTSVFLLCLMVCPYENTAQLPLQTTDVRTQTEKKSLVDTNYIMPFDGKLILRAFTSHKHNNFLVVSPQSNIKLMYQPNTTYNIGIGATWKAITLNVAYGFPFLEFYKNRGQTQYLDLQTHVYLRHWTVDLIGQFYNGFYISPNAFPNAKEEFYYREDMRYQYFGASIFRTANGRRFSFQSPFKETEWQKKSAGSFLYGLEIYYGVNTNEHGLVPREFNYFFGQDSIYRVHTLNGGPGLGYAYTLVVNRHWFATSSLTVTGMLGHFKYWHKTGVAENTWEINPAFTLRFALGYNSRNWQIALTSINSWMHFERHEIDPQFRSVIGHYRFTVSKRILPGSRLKNALNLNGRLN